MTTRWGDSWVLRATVGARLCAMLAAVALSGCGGGGGQTGAGGAAGSIGASGRGGAAGAGGLAGVAGEAAGAGGGGVAGADGTAGASGTTGAGGMSGSGGASGGGARGGTSGGSGGASGAGSTGTGGGGTAGAGGVAGMAGASGPAGAGGMSGASGGAGGHPCTTSVSGTVFDPAGTLPLYNVIVYAPTTALTAIADGVTCGRCGALSGAPAAMTVSDARGQFRLEGIPSGTNVPLVFQIGKWRRAVTIPTVTACADTLLTDVNLTRLPRTQAEGHIPRIAMSTGASDAFECFLRRVGIADSEFATDGGAGRVHLYAGGGGTDSFASGGTFAAAATLWSNPAKLASYDMVGFSCEGSTSAFLDQKPQTSVDNVTAYANAGGRLFLSHYHYYWLQKSPMFAGTATYIGTGTPPASSAADVLTVTVNQTFPGGMALAQWLAAPAVGASSMLGQLPVAGMEHSITAVNPPTTEWLYLPMNSADSQHRRAVELMSFPTPVGMPAANQCGKVLYADMHIKQSTSGGGGDDSDPGKPFPDGCKSNGMTPAMKAMEWTFFDLAACLPTP